MNKAPITWFSKRQSNVGAGSFSSEFVATGIFMEYSYFVIFTWQGLEASGTEYAFWGACTVCPKKLKTWRHDPNTQNKGVMVK